MTKRKRRRYSPEEKVKILRLHLLEKKPISDLSDEFGIHPTMFYKWQKEFFENGTRAFEPVRSGPENRLKVEVENLESKIQRKNEVLSELMEAHVLLKKELGEA